VTSRLPAFKELLRPGTRLTIGGAPEGHDARLLGALAAAMPSGVLHICRDDLRLSTLVQALAFFAPGAQVMQLPPWDCLPYDRISPNTEIVSRRMQVLSQLVVTPPCAGTILLTTMQATLQRIPARAELADAGFRIDAAAILDQSALTAYLTRSGYTRASTVMEPGEYAVRGGLIDIYPPGAEIPVRLDLFGDQVERIRRFDPLSQRSTTEEMVVSLVPVSEVPLDQMAIQRFRSGYRQVFGAVTDEDQLYQAVSEGRRDRKSVV
jgi:transcription-repair coupling factor (superfamily II helicase)